MDCPHFTTIVFQPDKVEKALLSVPDPAAIVCQGCIDEESRWICLACGIVNCGRYLIIVLSHHNRFAQGHALNHFSLTQHSVSLDLDTKACHWYILNIYFLIL